MYGLGSKIDLLRCFRSKMLRNYHVLSIHGYFPGLTIRDVSRDDAYRTWQYAIQNMVVRNLTIPRFNLQILSSLVVDIFKQDKCPRDNNEALSLIEECVKTKTAPIFILVNNIDGVVLRENKYQELFAKLAAWPNIHLIASIDHVNALTRKPIDFFFFLSFFFHEFTMTRKNLLLVYFCRRFQFGVTRS